MAACSQVVSAPARTFAQSNKILGKKKKKVRNLLVNPYDKYWVVEEENKLDNKRVDAKELMKLKRKKWSDDVVFAINDVSRCVTKGTVIAVLLADDVDPRFMVEHVATLCGVAAVPVLAITSLRKFTKSIIGFSTIALGLKKSVAESETNSFYKIHQLILEISEAYKPPPSIQQFNILAPEVCSGKSKKSVSMVNVPTIAPTKTLRADDVYLYRKNCESRVFVPKPLYPEKKESTEVIKKPKIGLEDFLSLSDDSDFDELMETDSPVRGISHSMLNLNSKKSHKPFVPYVPLKHIQVKPNPNKRTH